MQIQVHILPALARRIRGLGTSTRGPDRPPRRRGSGSRVRSSAPMAQPSALVQPHRPQSTPSTCWVPRSGDTVMLYAGRPPDTRNRYDTLLRPAHSHTATPAHRASEDPRPGVTHLLYAIHPHTGDQQARLPWSGGSPCRRLGVGTHPARHTVRSTRRDQVCRQCVSKKH